MPSAGYCLPAGLRRQRLTLRLLWRQLAGFFGAGLSIIALLALSDRLALSIL